MGGAHSIIELDEDGDIVRQIDAWEYLDPVEDPIDPDINRNEWTHANSLRTFAKTSAATLPSGSISISWCRYGFS